MGSELSHIMALRPVIFNWKDTTRDQVGNMGLIAQEVQSIYPNVVRTIYDDYLGIDYTALVVPTIKAVQELNLNLDAISGVITPAPTADSASFATAFFTNIKNTIGAWLGSADNNLEKICVKKSDGTAVCVNGDQLDVLLSSPPNVGGVPASGGGGGDMPTCTLPQVLVNNVCTDPVPEPTPEPVPEIIPAPEPEPSPAPISEPVSEPDPTPVPEPEVVLEPQPTPESPAETPAP
ncbi:hypothetical protein A2585_02895 [Candidatus Nomurabacteria bacterium RIFOXYD1_FULL_39_12]|nr:MAG: hypothetical protein A2585_02895 [Candidatus Nomurabacteria bacterium RIFOXYD1_FULL_39_12]